MDRKEKEREYEKLMGTDALRRQQKLAGRLCPVCERPKDAHAALCPKRWVPGRRRA